MPEIRATAINALEDIWFRHKMPKDTLEGLREGISKRDRAFLMELVYGVLRHRYTLEWILKNFLKKPSGLSHRTINNLRLGVYQLFYMRVPEWAVVNSAVRLEREKPAIINAVLRNIIREREGLSLKLKAMRDSIIRHQTSDKERVEYISILSSHPKWLIKRWIKRFGHKEAIELASANNEIAPLTLRVNTLKTNRSEVLRRLEALGIYGQPTTYSPDGIRLREFHAFRELEELKGLIIVQDEGAQLITYMLEPRAGERVLDACASPGGKTTHIAQLMNDKGEVIAVEGNEKRLILLKENISIFSPSSVKLIRADVNELKSKDIGLFDRILLDAPCSSLGVIRRNPDIKYRHTVANLLNFKEKQFKMLFNISRLLKRGGTLIYSTCSTEPEEGEEPIGKFLKTTDDFYIIRPDIPFIQKFLGDGFFRTYPHRDDMDGFFGVKICKR